MQARVLEVPPSHFLAANGNTLCLATNDGDIVIVDAKSGQMRRARGPFEAVTTTDKGSLVAFGRDEGEVRVVDLPSGEERFRFDGDQWIALGSHVVTWRDPRTYRGTTKAELRSLSTGDALGKIELSSETANVVVANETSVFAFVYESARFQAWSLANAKPRFAMEHRGLRFIGPAFATRSEVAVVASRGKKKTTALVVLDAESGAVRQVFELAPGVRVRRVLSLDERFAALTDGELLVADGEALVPHTRGARMALKQHGARWVAYFGDETEKSEPLPRLCVGERGGPARLFTPRRPAHFAIGDDALLLIHSSEIDIVPWALLATNAPVVGERVRQAPPKAPRRAPEAATVVGASGNLLRVRTSSSPLVELVIAHPPGSKMGPLGLARDAEVFVSFGRGGQIESFEFEHEGARSRYVLNEDRFAPATDLVEIGVAGPLPGVAQIEIGPELERLASLGIITPEALATVEARRLAADVAAEPSASRLARALRGAANLSTPKGVRFASAYLDEPSSLARDLAPALPKDARLTFRVDSEVTTLTVTLKHGTKSTKEVVDFDREVDVAGALQRCFDALGIDLGVLDGDPATQEPVLLMVAPKPIVASVRAELARAR